MTAQISTLIDKQDSVELIRASDPSSSSVSAGDRVEHLFQFAVSTEYIAARKKLGIAIG